MSFCHRDPLRDRTPDRTSRADDGDRLRIMLDDNLRAGPDMLQDSGEIVFGFGHVQHSRFHTCNQTSFQPAPRERSGLPGMASGRKNASTLRNRVREREQSLPKPLVQIVRTAKRGVGFSGALFVEQHREEVVASHGIRANGIPMLKRFASGVQYFLDVCPSPLLVVIIVCRVALLL